MKTARFQRLAASRDIPAVKSERRLEQLGANYRSSALGDETGPQNQVK